MTGAGLLAHRVEGEGEPLLLLNGGLMTYAAWEPVAARLRQRHRLVLCDLRGQLLSPGPPPRDLAGNIPDLTALLDHLGIGSIHVLGTSYGGAIAVLLAAREPQRVRSLVAVTVADHADGEMRRRTREWRGLVGGATDRAARGRFHDSLAEAVYSEGFRRQARQELAARREQVAGLPDAWFESVGGILAAVQTFDLRPYLGAIGAPTLVVAAGQDRLMPRERALGLTAGTAGAELLVHPTSGHALVAEDPAWLADAALEFLARHAAREENEATD